jgi:hypothetical protein
VDVILIVERSGGAGTAGHRDAVHEERVVRCAVDLASDLTPAPTDSANRKALESGADSVKASARRSLREAAWLEAIPLALFGHSEASEDRAKRTRHCGPWGSGSWLTVRHPRSIPERGDGC